VIGVYAAVAVLAMLTGVAALGLTVRAMRQLQRLAHLLGNLRSELVDLHAPMYGFCVECGGKYPCRTLQLAMGTAPAAGGPSVERHEREH
jgi:hypothetical protein